MVGGGGEKRTLRLVAQYADACNLFDLGLGPEGIPHKLDVLRAALRRRRPRLRRDLEDLPGPAHPRTPAADRCPTASPGTRSTRPSSGWRACGDAGIDHVIFAMANTPTRAYPLVAEVVRQVA